MNIIGFSRLQDCAYIINTEINFENRLLYGLTVQFPS